MELLEYGGSGRRSFVIIPEGDEGMGWKECRAQLLWLKQHYEKQRSEGSHVSKTPVETKVGNVVKELKEVHGKVSYTEAVMGKGMEAEQRIPALAILQMKNLQGGAQHTGDHGAATVKEKPIQESAEDKLTVDHAGLNEKRFLRLITEGNFMAIRNMLIAFREEINSCLEKIEVGMAPSWAGQKMGLKMVHQQAESWVHVGQPEHAEKITKAQATLASEKYCSYGQQKGAIADAGAVARESPE
jgi:hypothetical protein